MNNCKNCNTQLLSKNDFCPNCGGKVIRNRLTIKALFAHFSEQFLNYDNKFLKTFLHLFTKPEEVIDGYINGTRKRYVNVISYFAIALTVAGLHLFILQKFFPEMMDFSAMIMEGQEDMFDASSMNKILEYQSLLMMAYIPFLALISKIVFFNIKKYNYTEHVVMFVYIIAQTSIISAIIAVFAAVFGITYGEISFALLLPLFIYITYCLKKLYNLNLKRIFIKTLIFIPIFLLFYLVSILLFGLSYVIYIVVTGNLQEFMETFKPKT